ncbi:MAG TPA: YdeI/OmpD-associated family protein [Blastocatellia bacterium]|nr:YdeI/OmpD-associated family protein [Blastocatellia bacterium]
MGSAPETLNGLPVILFRRQKDWAVWLDKNHARSSGLWLRLAKKASGVESVSYAEALEVALCYGWIDGLKKSYDETSWLQKFTPRGARSMWSKINREKAEELIKSGRMKPAGLKAIENARQNRRWETAYDSYRTATVPDDFQAELDRNRRAKAFFATLDRTNRYAVLFRIQTARNAETRAKRIEQFILMLEKHEKLHP